jgi:hypothetical protein
MNDFFSPTGATGLPRASKPLCAAAASWAEPGTAEVGVVNCAPGADVAGPGGNSSGPERPQPDSPRAAKTAEISTKRPLRRTPAKTRPSSFPPSP